MTQRLTFILTFLPGLLCAQLDWEHTYSGARLQRIVLDVSGETYLQTNNCTLQLFHPDHTLWQNLTLTPPWDAAFCANYLLSEKYIDDDPAIETIYDWSTDDISCPVTGCTLEDDDGTPFWLNKHAPAPQFSMPPGLAPRLLAGSTVYTLPGAVLEKDYGPDQQVQRLPLQQGDCYVVYKRSFNTPFEGFNLYDFQHRLCKTVNLSVEDFQDLCFISQDYFNSDTLLEFAGVRRVTGDALNDRRLTVVQENGQVLLDYPCRGAVKASEEGLPDVYWIWRALPSGESTTELLDFRNLAIRHSFTAEKTGMRFSPDGKAVFYWTQRTNNDSIIRVHDADFQLTKTFLFPEPYRHFWNLQVTKGRFSAGDAFEFWFTNSRNGEIFVTCLDENGQKLYDFPRAKEAHLDHRPGLEDRFFVVYADSTAVYRFAGAATGAGAPKQELSDLFYPNPFSTELLVQLPEGVSQISLLDRIGRPVQYFRVPENTELFRIPAEQLPAGVYFLRYGQKTVKVCKF